MATTNEWRYSGVTCMLLLPQLTQIWLPDNNAVDYETGRDPPSEQAPSSQIPPLISFLEDLPDFLTPDEAKGKKFPCGHVVSVRSILACSNLFGDRTWTPGPYFLGCGQPECNETLEFPKIPDPRVLDGLQSRLDLIQWSWNKDTPTKGDVNTVSLLRDMLSRIGHTSREPETEPDSDADQSRSEPIEPSLARTLTLMETETFGLMVLYQGKSSEVPLRGSQPYCRYRDATAPAAGHPQLRYPMPSPGQYCECATPHVYQREPGSWALTPAETQSEPGEPKAEKATGRKTVRFVAPVVTRVRYFEPWWCDEYRDSGRYWSTGPHRRSVDLSTQADDEGEIERLEEHPEGVAAEVSADHPEDSESDCSTLAGDEEVPKGKEAAEGSSGDKVADEDVLDEMERANGTFDSELLHDLDELKKQHESWGEWF